MGQFIVAVKYLLKHLIPDALRLLVVVRFGLQIPFPLQGQIVSFQSGKVVGSSAFSGGDIGIQ